MEATHKIILIHPDTAQRREVPLTSERLSIGAAEGNAIRLRRDGVADQQCSIIALSGGGHKVVDEHTDHGTCVNGEFIAQRLLKPGDRIDVGGFLIEYALVTAAASAAPAVDVGARTSEPAPRATPTPSPTPAPVYAAPPPAQVELVSPGPGDAAPRAPRRSRGGEASLGRSVLYLATAGVVLMVFVKAVPGMLGSSPFADTWVDDRLDLVRVLRQGGDLDRARNVLIELSVQAPGNGVDQALRSIDSIISKDRHARERLAHFQADKASDARTQLKRYQELLDQYEDVPGVTDDIEAEVRKWQRAVRLEEQRDTESVSTIADLSDGLLRAHDYTGARQLLKPLSDSGLLIDEELRASAELVIDTVAEVEADRILDQAEERVASGDLLGALGVLEEDRVLAFRGTPVFQVLDQRAQDIEELAKTQALSGSLVNALPPRVEPVRRPPPAITSAESAPRERTPESGATAEAGASTDSSPPARTPRAPTARRPVDQAVARGDEAFARGALGDAIAEYQSGLDAARASLDREHLTRRMERANRARWFLDALRNYVEAEPTTTSTLRVTDRSGAVSGSVLGAAADGLRLQGSAGEVELPMEQLSTASCQQLARKYPLTAEDHLNRAYYLLIDGSGSEFDAATMKADEEARLKPALDSVIAFHRGDAEVPDWGYFRHDGRWLTFKEREHAENMVALTAILKKIERADSDEDKYKAATEELKAMVPVAREDIARLLRERRAGMVEKLTGMSEVAAVEKVFTQRAELDRRREAALALIFDTERYFYPYKPPECPPDKAALYAEVQHEVDELVDAVRDVWGNEFSPLESGVSLSPKFRKLRRQLAIEGEILALAEPRGFENEPSLARIDLLPMDAPKVTVRNIAIDRKERASLDESQQTLAYNVRAQTSAASHEVDQIQITNMYRLMMGRRALAIHDLLCKAARGHGDWMSRTGKFAHINDEDPALATPAKRIAAQGYSAGGSGENIAISGSAAQAHSAWCHSSGHHRNILFAGHRELGVGGVGRYWVQNFAGGGDYTGNLEDPDGF